MKSFSGFVVLGSLVLLAFGASLARTDEPGQLPRAIIDGEGPGWRSLGGEDFTNVNCNPDTWTWKGGHVYCTGKPTGVIRTKKTSKNFELVAQWQHKWPGGNSGIFVWATEDGMKGLMPDDLPKTGIEIQALDHGYRALYAEKSGGKKDDWFTTDGDVFAVGRSKLKPFPPVSPDGSRSFPRKRLTKGAGEWNHYYVRAINGEVRLWVNGEEVSGGSGASPSEGYLCLESEGSPVEFKNLRLREVP
jgi:hypothetical protein